jgi:eukaryotic-like serine/threonine-protein kinase
MTLPPGTRLGAYEILNEIGVGGMGEVYRARDSRLSREVAIKVVRRDFADDSDRLARFEREARLLASLTHPHIATIYGLEQAGDVLFLVMELVAGATLADRLVEGPLPIGEALTIASQIGAAIETAHDRGIIHRDLKPSNIKLSPESGVKVLDFGLAKALSVDSAAQMVNQPTMSSGGTGEGTILGTAAYMSPEQARGKDVDKRTDIWAFGCVLYDMLTGRPAFAGPTLTDTLANILTRDPDWVALPERVPESISHLLRRCLQKDARRRVKDIGDARLEIDESLARVSDATAVFPSRAQPQAPKRAAGATTVLTVAIGSALITAGAVWALKPAPPALTRSIVQFTLPFGSAERLTGLDFPAIALSPAETHVAYVATLGGTQQLFVRPLSALVATPLPGTEGALAPFFSADSEWIGFFADNKLKKIRVNGGSARTIADAPIGFGASWTPDNTIVFAPSNSSALWRVSADGGTPTAVTQMHSDLGEFSHRWPELLPDGKTLLFTAGTAGSWDDADIVAQPLQGGERRTVIQGGTSPHYLLDGRLLYARNGTLFMASVDPKTGRVIAESTSVLSGVLQSSDGAAQLSLSRAGGLAYIHSGTRENASALLWVDRHGDIQPLAAPPRAYSSPRLSPDGRTIALTIAGDRDEIWSYTIAQNSLARLASEPGTAPMWSRDGGSVFFSASRRGPANLFSKRLETAVAEERLTSSGRSEVPYSISPDGRLLAFVTYDSTTGRDIRLLQLDDRQTRPWLVTIANETAPAFSPDGRVIAYVSDETGRNEVYVARVGDPERHVQVSREGGSEPVWRPDGGELFFRAGERMMAADVKANVTVDAPHTLFGGHFQTGLGGRPAYDVSRDGARFLMVQAREDNPSARELRVILGWAGTLPSPARGAATGR